MISWPSDYASGSPASLRLTKVVLSRNEVSETLLVAYFRVVIRRLGIKFEHQPGPGLVGVCAPLRLLPNFSIPDASRWTHSDVIKVPI